MRARANLVAIVLLYCGLAACDEVLGTEEGNNSPPDVDGSGTSGAGGAGGAGAASGTSGTSGTGSTSSRSGTEFVSAGQQSASANYRMVFTLGQPTQNQGKSTSTSYRLQGGLIGANGSLP